MFLQTEGMIFIWSPTNSVQPLSRWLWNDIINKPECTVLLKPTSRTTEKLETSNYTGYFQEECRIIHPGYLMHRLRRVYISRKSSASPPFRIDPPSETILMPTYRLQNRKWACDRIWAEWMSRMSHRVPYNGHGWVMFFTRWKDLCSGLESKVSTQHLRPSVVRSTACTLTAGLIAMFSPQIQTLLMP